MFGINKYKILDELIKCETCKCLGYKEDFKTVVKEYMCLYYSSDYLFYCHKCKPEYDKIVYHFDKASYYKIIKEHEEEVKIK
jgi:hypothetical protein